MVTALDLLDDVDLPSKELKKAIPKVTKKEVEKQPFITGDFAKTQAANLSQPGKTMADLLDEDLNKEITGYNKARPMPLLPPEQVDEALGAPKTGGDLYTELKNSFTARPKAIDPKHGSPLLRKALSVLSADENAEVKLIYKAAGLDKLYGEKKDFSDYTYTTLLKDVTGRDDLNNEIAGTILGIALAPSTYLTFGQSGIAKGVTRAGSRVVLNEAGEKLAKNIVKEQSEKAIARAEAKLGSSLSPDDANKIRQATQKNVNKELVQKFSQINEAGKAENLSQPVKNLSDDIFDPGGIKFMEKEVLSGKKIAELTKPVADAFNALKQRKDALGKVANFGSESIADTTKFLKKLFVPLDQQEKDLVDIRLGYNQQANKVREGIIAKQNERFKDLSEAQKEDFSKTAYTFSKKSRELMLDKRYDLEEALGRELNVVERKELIDSIRKEIGPVTSLGGDKKVQDKLDQFFAQGKFKGQVSEPENFAKISALGEGDEVPIWFPFIDKRLDINKIRTPSDFTSPSVRKFLNEADLNKDVFEYMKDPATALAFRRVEAAFANIQDAIYDNIIKNKMGGMLSLKEYQALPDAEKALYSEFRRLPTQRNIDKIGKQEPVFAREEFVEGYNQQFKGKKQANIPGLSWATDLWKRNVTTLFPGFHFRNAASNIALNIAQLGRHAISPERQKDAVSMLLGKNLNKISINDIGEKLTLGGKLKEAKELGLIGDDFLDLTKTFTNDKNKTAVDAMFSTMNPLSKDFGVYKLGKNFGSFIENQAKLVNYGYWRDRGLSPKMAAHEAQQALFDYGQITNFERWANLFLPFYTFSRKNLEAQMKLFAHRPGAIIGQLKAMRDLGPSDKEWEQMPEWAQKRFVAKLKGEMFSGFGLPLEDILELGGSDAKALFLRLNPILKYFYEKNITERDTFTGRNVKELNSANEFRIFYNLSKDKSIPEPLRKLADDVREHLKLEVDPHNFRKTIGDPDKLHMLRNSFTSRYQSTLGLLTDPQQGTNEALMRFLMGIVKIPKDQGRQLSIYRTKKIEEFVDRVLKTNNSRTLNNPIFVGDDEWAVKLNSAVIKSMQDAQTKKEIDALFQERDKELKLEQKIRGRFKK